MCVCVCVCLSSELNEGEGYSGSVGGNELYTKNIEPVGGALVNRAAIEFSDTLESSRKQHRKSAAEDVVHVPGGIVLSRKEG